MATGLPEPGNALTDGNLVKYARLQHDGTIRHAAVHDDHVELLTSSPLADARATGEQLPLRDADLLVPVEPAAIVCVGRNYLDHIREMDFPVPERPWLFFKPATTLLPPGGDVILPPASLAEEIEHEAELALVIGRQIRNVPPDQALDAVFGVTAADDVSARDLQRADGNNVRGKAIDTFCPLGPWIDTDVDLTRPLAVRCHVNGELRQDGTTADLVFDLPTLISTVAGFMTLRPGDVILTGSPGGTGPLVAGDRVEIDVDEVGTLHHGVANAP